MSHSDIHSAAELLASGDLEAATPEQEKALRDELYAWYLNSVPLPRQGGPVLPYELSLPAALRAAHVDAMRFEGGWKAVSASTWGRAAAEKGPLLRTVERHEYTIPRRPGALPRPNDALLVSRYWAWVDDETGFWQARRGVWPPADADRLVRTYWNAVPSHAPVVLGRLSRLLSDSKAASSMIKTPASPEHGGRADAMVVYLGPADFAAVERDLRAVAHELAPGLRSARPRFTLELAPGVGLAEGSLDGDSFGEARCRLMVRAFAAASPEERGSADRLATRIARALTGAGLDPDRPYLEPNADRDYVD